MNMSTNLLLAGISMMAVALAFLVIPPIVRKQKITTTVRIFAFAIPALALGFYMLLGRPDAPNNNAVHLASDARRGAMTGGGSTGRNIGSVESMLIGLEQKLETEPADAKGWLLLAKSYSYLGRVEDAKSAYEKAKGLGQLEPELESKLYQSGEESSISPVIRGRLTIADIARDRLDPDDSIFVFAKPVDGAAMPVAVLRKIVSDLPFDFELSDRQAMSAFAKLSSTSVVKVIARVSKSGNAMQAEPGLEVVSRPIKVGDSVFVELHLDPATVNEQS